VITILPLAKLVPEGLRITPTTDADGIRDTLADVTEAALSEGGFDDLVDYFVDADRDRLSNYADRDFGTLNGRITQIKKAWWEKYQTGIETEREREIFGPSFRGFHIIQAELTNPVFLSANWPIEPTPGQKPDIKRSPDLYRDDEGHIRVRDLGDKNLEAGRDLAVAHFPKSQGLPELNVSMIEEAFGWKIDVPDNMSGRDLRRKLLNHLTYFGEHVDQWPANRDEAFRQLTHHVLMACYGLDVPAYRSQQSNPKQEGSDRTQTQQRQH